MPFASTLEVVVKSYSAWQVPGEPPEPAQQSIRVSIAPNPSHLEAVSPVVLGMVRAEQMRARDTDCTRIMGLLIHGDAAFSGLGLVSESLQLSNVKGAAKARILLACMRSLQTCTSIL